MRKVQVQVTRYKVQGSKARIAHHFGNVRPGFRTVRGFTLIEVLIAMTLLSMMVVLLFGSLKICAQSWEQGENKIAEVNEAAAVYNFFQRHLSSAIPLWDDFSSNSSVNAASRQETGALSESKDRVLSFQGKKQSLRFVSVFPASAGRSGMQLFSLKLWQQDGEQVVKVSLTPFFPLIEGEEWREEEVVLLKHVGDFSLAYFGADVEGEESRWQDEWVDKKAQPRLVKISIGTDNGMFWPEMIIGLKVSGVAIDSNTANDTEPVGATK